MDETEILQQAQQAIERGDKAIGGHLLYKVIRQNPQNETAWFLLSTVMDDEEKKRECLARVLDINPHNQSARQKLAALGAASSKRERIVQNTVAPLPVAASDSPKNKWVTWALLALNIIIIVGACATISGLAANNYALRTRFESYQRELVGGSTERNLQPLVTDGAGDDEIASEPSSDGIAGEFETSGDQSAEIVTKTPDPITDALVTYGGKYLLLRMQAFPGLTVYDTDKREIVNTLRLASDNFLFASGGNIVLVYYPENNLLQTWSLDTFEKLKTKPNPKGNIISYMTMGHSNPDQALVRYADGTDALARASVYLLDTATLQEIPLTGDENAPGRNVSYRDFIHQRTDGSMQIVSEWATSHSPTGLGVFVLTGNSWTFKYEHTSVGYIAVGDDGLLYAQNGDIYNSQLTRIGSLSGTKLIPGIGGTLFLGIAQDGLMQVYTSGSISPLGPVGRFPGAEKIEDGWAKTPYVFDRHVIFDPVRGHIILIPPENDRVVQREFNLEQMLSASGVDYLVVTSRPDVNVASGETWRYQIETLSNADGITFTLEFGPEGMEVSDDGTLVWDVPDDYSGTEKVVLLVENENGEVIYHNFELYVR